MNTRSAFLFFFGSITFMNLSLVYTAGAPAGRTADDDKIAQIFDVFTWIQRQHHTEPFAALYKILRAQYSSEPFTSATSEPAEIRQNLATLFDVQYHGPRSLTTDQITELTKLSPACCIATLLFPNMDLELIKEYDNELTLHLKKPLYLTVEQLENMDLWSAFADVYYINVEQQLINRGVSEADAEHIAQEVAYFGSQYATSYSTISNGQMCVLNVEENERLQTLYEAIRRTQSIGVFLIKKPSCADESSKKEAAVYHYLKKSYDDISESVRAYLNEHINELIPATIADVTIATYLKKKKEQAAGAETYFPRLPKTDEIARLQEMDAKSDSDEVRAEVSALEETLKRTAELKREADDLRHQEEALPSEFAQKEADREAELLRKRQELYDRYDAILEKSLKAIDEHAKREYALQEQIAETKFGWLNQSQKKPWLEEQKRAIELQASEARQKAEQENSKSKRLVKTTLDNAKAYGQALAESPEPPASEQPLWHHDGMAHGDEVSKTEQLQAKRNERARDAAFGAILTGGTAVATSIAALVFYYHQQKLLTRMRALSGDKNILNTIETSPQKLEPKHAKELKQLYARYTSTKTRALSSGIITAAAAALTIPLAMGASHYKKIANGTT